MFTKKFGLVCVFAAASLLSAVSVQAELINLNVRKDSGGTMTGAAALGAAGDVWNNWTVPDGDTNLIESTILTKDSTGATVAVGFEVANALQIVQTYTPGAVGPGVATDVVPLMHSYMYLENNDNGLAGSTLTLSGLTNNGSYNIVLYTGDDSPSQLATFTIAGNSKTITPLGVTHTLATGGEGKDYVTFSGVQASSTGEIEIGWKGVSGQYSGFGGLQIQSVPEPATTGLLGMAALFGMLAYAWRKRK